MYKKILLAMVTIVTFGAGALAEEFASDTFLGVSVGFAQVKGDTGGIFGEPNHKGNGIDYGLRVGAQNNDWRTTLAVNFFDKDDQNLETLKLSVDYRFGQNERTTLGYMIDPYIGLNIGYGNYESTGIDESGFLYGAEAGIAMMITPVFQVDLGYSYSVSKIDALSNVGRLQLGLNYYY